MGLGERFVGDGDRELGWFAAVGWEFAGAQGEAADVDEGVGAALRGGAFVGR